MQYNGVTRFVLFGGNSSKADPGLAATGQLVQLLPDNHICGWTGEIHSFPHKSNLSVFLLIFRQNSILIGNEIIQIIYNASNASISL